MLWLIAQLLYLPRKQSHLDFEKSGSLKNKLVCIDSVFYLHRVNIKSVNGGAILFEVMVADKEPTGDT